jgi:hypothetical protein
MTAPLPAVYSVADVAAALGETERFVSVKCRQRAWPHRRGSRGRVSFTADDYAQILELCSAPPAAAEDAPRWALAPRSRRAS